MNLGTDGGSCMNVALKLAVAFVLFSVPGMVAASPQPEAVTVVDPEQDKVIRVVPISERLVLTADWLLRQRKVYGGLSVPEGWIVRIPLPGGRRIKADRSTFTITEMLLIKRKNTDETVILLFDPHHRPYLYAADRVAASRLLRMLEL